MSFNISCESIHIPAHHLNNIYIFSICPYGFLSKVFFMRLTLLSSPSIHPRFTQLYLLYKVVVLCFFFSFTVKRMFSPQQAVMVMWETCDMHNMKNNGKYRGGFVYNCYVRLLLTARRHFFLLEARRTTRLQQTEVQKTILSCSGGKPTHMLLSAYTDQYYKHFHKPKF